MLKEQHLKVNLLIYLDTEIITLLILQGLSNLWLRLDFQIVKDFL